MLDLSLFKTFARDGDMIKNKQVYCPCASCLQKHDTALPQQEKQQIQMYFNEYKKYST